MQSVTRPGVKLTKQQAKDEQAQLTQFNKLVESNEKLKKFHTIKIRERREQLNKSMQVSEHRNDSILKMRQEERRQMRALEKSLVQKQSDKEQLRAKMQTTANRDFFLKVEKRKLRQNEIMNFKEENQIDRKFKADKIVKRQLQLQE